MISIIKYPDILSIWQEIFCFKKFVNVNKFKKSLGNKKVLFIFYLLSFVLYNILFTLLLKKLMKL